MITFSLGLIFFGVMLMTAGWFMMRAGKAHQADD
jgi:hypothetical protein